MLLAPWRAGRVLSSMRAYRDVVCCVCLGERRRSSVTIGIARSDSYLSSATAFSTIRVGTANSGRLGSALRRELADVPVGALLLALPLRGVNSPRRERQRRVVARALSALGPGVGSRARALGWRVPKVAWNERTSSLVAWHSQRTNPQWEGVGSLAGARPWAASDAPGFTAKGASGPCASVHAAVALQGLLDQEMGGWPNTFG